MWHAVPVGAGLGSECREKWLCTWGGCVLDQVGCSWRCWRHPDACGVGVKVADHHSRRAPWEALGDFIQGGSGRVCGQIQGGGRHMEYMVLGTLMNIYFLALAHADLLEG